jgi:parvulin-like peptidyl-prolyl cis-trans isomerase-like protein/PPIC-type peptidyl-prolyl cis-trans isomerase-like protein
MRAHHLRDFAAAVLTAVFTIACQSKLLEAEAPRAEVASTARQEPSPPSGDLPHGAPDPTPLTAYPPGRWRLDPAQLQNVSLHFSHILVRHASVSNADVSFCSAYWHSQPPLPARSRREALALAREVALLAQRQPGRFAELARLYSEDVTTRERGGSLGGVSAASLFSWSPILDALAALPVGGVSEVIESEFGFHVIERRAVPVEQLVTGSHIVIGHDQAEFLWRLRGMDTPGRSREGGLARAQAVRAAAAAHPERFASLVAEYSDHLDVLVDGDVGTWSTHETTDYPRIVEGLSALRVGEVSQPFETLFGWEILLREPNRERTEYAMTPIEIPFGFGAAEGAQGEAAPDRAEKRANELARILKQAPDRFDELQQQGCCKYVAQWPEGRGWPPLMAVLKQLKPGQVAPSALVFGMSYIVPKRVTAGPPTKVVTYFELPEPEEVNLTWAFALLQGDRMGQQLRQLGERVSAELALAPGVAEELKRLHEGILASTGESPDRQLSQVRSGVSALLGEPDFSRYIALMKRQFSDAILDPGEGARSMSRQPS